MYDISNPKKMTLDLVKNAGQIGLNYAFTDDEHYETYKRIGDNKWQGMFYHHDHDSIIEDIDDEFYTDEEMLERMKHFRYPDYVSIATKEELNKHLNATKTTAPRKSGMKSTMRFLQNSVRNMF